jgi:antitoxin HicB
MTHAPTSRLVFAYPYRAEPQPEGGYTITFRDLPEAITQAEEGESLDAIAGECLSEALAARLDDGEEIPPPSTRKSDKRFAFPETNIEHKIEFHYAFRKSGLTQVELAKRMGVTPLVVRRLLDPRHKSHVQQYDEALRALGASLYRTVEIRSAA